MGKVLWMRWNQHLEPELRVLIDGFAPAKLRQRAAIHDLREFRLHQHWQRQRRRHNRRIELSHPATLDVADEVAGDSSEQRGKIFPAHFFGRPPQLSSATAISRINSGL